jgi:tRNA threonylcarbamoyladenosine biosynthesis protein TsaE
LESASDSSIFKFMQAQNRWLTTSPEQTIERGRLIAKSFHPGSVIALEGDLGSGKTTLIKGIALGLGVRTAREVKSPTFVIMHVYQGRIPLYHFDLYRLDEQSDLEAIGLEEFMNDPDSVSVIEWADRVPNISKEADFVIKLARKGTEEREIRLYSHEQKHSRR